jgi:deoxyribodipyrimidine photolyase-related protein
MRHYRDARREEDFTVHYQPADADDVASDVADFLHQQIEAHEPERVVLTEPGRYGDLQRLQAVTDEAGTPLDVQADDHFLCTHRHFDAWADGRSSLTMEYFYRMMRQEYGVLLDENNEPAGDTWNYDDQNRESFSEAPPDINPPTRHRPDEVTQDVIDLVQTQFADAPGSLDSFIWPVTPEEARRDVRDFIEHRLPTFGTYQDAMWTDEPFLYHSRLSAALNLKLVDPRYVIEQAEDAYRAGHAPINAVEGFIRQILGWREFIRGVYWQSMPDYAEKNALDATADLPDFFWTADTDMTCMRQSLGQIVDYGYAHHIQRLMVTGLFGLLYGVDPKQMNAWHEAMYVDAWEWVSLPNMVGMSQYADGGIVGTKPYTASGNYINKMSNYCQHCVYNYKASTGEDACPFTTLYWDFLDRHEDRLSGNRRMNFQMANLRRKGDDTRAAIRERAETVRQRAADGSL